MDRIQKVSTYLVAAFKVLLVLLPLVIIGTWLFLDSALVNEVVAEGYLLETVETPEGVVNLSTIAGNPLAKGVGLMGSLLAFLPLYLSLFVLIWLFKNYRKGEIFTANNARYYKYLGWLFFLDGLIIKPLSEMITVLAATLINPLGHRYLTIGFGTVNIEALFCGVLVIVISWIMLEGYKLNEERKFII